MEGIQNQEQEWRWCLVGNIVQTHEYGENHETQIGVKHFSPGTKVYCMPGNCGDSDKSKEEIQHMLTWLNSKEEQQN